MQKMEVMEFKLWRTEKNETLNLQLEAWRRKLIKIHSYMDMQVDTSVSREHIVSTLSPEEGFASWQLAEYWLAT